MKLYIFFFNFFFVCVGIPYEDDDYRDNNGDYDNNRPNDLNSIRPNDLNNIRPNDLNNFRPNDLNNIQPNDLNNIRPYDHHGGNRYIQQYDMNRQTQFDVGGGRDPPVDYGLRGYQSPRLIPNHLQPQQFQQPIQPQQTQFQLQQPQQGQAQGQVPLGVAYDGRAGGFGYNPYGTYNPYNYRPGYYGWNRPAQSADLWRSNSVPTPGSSLGLLNPLNLFGLGGSSSYRPWWSSNRFPSFGLF